MNDKKKKRKTVFTILLLLLSLGFLILMVISPVFFEWTFSRHQNILSWYIRPLFLIPFCVFAYKRNPFGIALTIFLLLTSMFWFPKPVVISEQVQTFLAMEKEYLLYNWNLPKVLITLLVPLSLGLLGRAFWVRSVKSGFAILFIIALAKIFWSIIEGGRAGLSVIIPAMIGLLLCIIILLFFLQKGNQRKTTKENKE